MADMIKSVDGIAIVGEIAGIILLLLFVFTQPMNDQQHRFYILFGKPTLIVNINISNSLEVAIDVFHMILLILNLL